MDERNNNFDFDFTPIGQAIKKAREARGMTREQLSGIIGYAPRHIQSIENEGQYPSIELFIQLITMFDVSVDEYIFPDNEVKKSSVRRRLDAQLDNLDDKELSVIEKQLLSDYVRQKSQRNKPLVFLLPILNRQERRSHRWSCFQPYIAFACKRRQSYPPRCKRHRFRISPQCLHGRFLRRLPNQKR